MQKRFRDEDPSMVKERKFREMSTQPTSRLGDTVPLVLVTHLGPLEYRKIFPGTPTLLPTRPWGSPERTQARRRRFRHLLPRLPPQVSTSSRLVDSKPPVFLRSSPHEDGGTGHLSRVSFTRSVQTGRKHSHSTYWNP